MLLEPALRLHSLQTTRLDDPSRRNAVGLVAGELFLEIPALLPDGQRVSAFEGSEGLNCLFTFTIVLWMDPAELPELAAFIGKRAALTIPHPYGVRYVHGILSEAVRLDAAPTSM